VAASKNMVCVVGHAGAKGWDTTHGSKEIKQGADKVRVCKIYPNIVCSDHVDIFKERAGAVFGDKVFATPHHLYYTPTGEEMFRNAGVKSAQELAKDMTDALSKVTGTHVPKDEYDAAKAEIAKGAAHVKKDEIKKAIELFTKMANHKNVQLQPMGKKELDALSASGDARYNTALQTLETQGGEEQAKKELKKIADEYAPLPCAKKAAEILKLMAEKGR
jgi:hypothetical protein